MNAVVTNGVNPVFTILTAVCL